MHALITAPVVVGIVVGEATGEAVVMATERKQNNQQTQRTKPIPITLIRSNCKLTVIRATVHKPTT